MGGACGLLLLLCVVGCAAVKDTEGTELSVGSSTTTSSDDQPYSHSLPVQDIDAEERNGMVEGNESKEKDTEDKNGLGVDEGLAEDGPSAGSRLDPTARQASSRRLFVGKDSAPSLSTNATTNRTRDLLTWRLKDQTRLKDLTNKILASVKDQWRRNEEFGILKKHPHDVGTSDGQSEAGSQVVERRVAPPKHFSRRPNRLTCSRRQGCKSANETLELRRRLMHDLQSSFSVPLPSRIRYRLKKKPSIYTSKKPSSRLDIGVPDIYETEVSITPKLRRHPSARRTQNGASNEFGFAADRKFHQIVLPEAQQHVALEALAAPDHAATDDETSTQTYIPLSSVPAANRPSNLVYRPPRRPPGSQRRRTSGLLRRPSPPEPHYFTTPSSLQHLSVHLPYRRPVSFRYSRTSSTSNAGSKHSTSSAPKVHHSTITGQDKSTHVTSAPLHSSTASGNTQPSQKYLPPNKEYIPPGGALPKVPTGGGTTKPSVHYVPPENEYIPPKNPHKPTAKPEPSVEPPRTYQPPTKEYIPPEPPRQTSTLGEPPRKYLPPDQDYKAPTEESEKPHSQPPRKYLPPNKEYLAPKANQGEVLPPPSKEHQSSPPSGVPSRHYLPPNKNYKTPFRRPHRPSLEHKTPATGYPAPPRKYLPPDKNFASDGIGQGGRRPPHRRRRPSKRRRKNRKRPTPPGRKYLPPNKEYVAPQSGSNSAKEPSKTYETPDKEYLPPKDYSAHTDSLSATTVTVPFTVPSRTYLPPHLDHTTAAPSYIASTPHPDYVSPHVPASPTSSHKQPHSGYGPPNVTYEPPVRTYQPPTKNYVPPQGTTLPGWLQSIKTDHVSSGPDLPEVYVSRFPPPLKVFASHHTSPITTPQPAYTPPVRTYQPPVNDYLPPTLTSVGPTHHTTTPKPTFTGLPPPPPLHRPLDPAFLPVPKRPSTHYLPPQVGYQSPGYADAAHPTATPKPHYITIILPPETSPKPEYVPPSSPKKNYVPPSSPKPDYVPPSSPKQEYVPPASPKPEYVPPSSPKPDYVPPSSPKPDYVPPASPKPDYVPPSSPKPDYVPPSSPKKDYVPPSSPKPEYVPPSSPKPDYVPPSPPKKEYVPPSTPKPSYVPPSSPKPEYVPPSSAKPDNAPPKLASSHARPPARVTTYRPVHDPKVQELQDFSHPGKSRPSRPSSPPVYYPTTPGPGYNELPSHITGHHPLLSYIDDYYDDDYYYDDEDDYYYYYDDDYYYDYDDYYDYYYYYDDYDYSPYSAPLRTPFHLTFQDDYDIHESDILEYGYIAGIPGRAGRDYPILSYIPLTSFGCDLVADYPGYYADMEAGCQVFHICHRSGRQDSFLCPNGTVFNQKYFVCDWWYNFACEDAPFFYPVNAAIGQPGVPLHRNAFEPDLRVVHSLPPLHTRPRPHPQPHPATPIPHHPDSLPELVTLAPLPPELVHAALE